MIRSYAERGKPDSEQRRCFDCAHCMGAVSWWCVSKDAVAFRGTSIPGIRDCQFWEPLRTKKWWMKWSDNWLGLDCT